MDGFENFVRGEKGRSDRIKEREGRIKDAFIYLDIY